MNIQKYILLVGIFFLVLICLFSIQKNYIFFTYLSFFLIVVLSFIFFLKKEIINLFFIISFSSIISLYLFEIYYSLQDRSPRNLAIKEASRTNTSYDFRTKKEVFIYEKKRKTNINVAVPVTGMDYLKFNQNYKINNLILSGVSNSFNVFCNESGYWTYYFSDRFGFNNPDFVWEMDERKNIFLIGDSNVHGGCVAVEKSIAGQLRSISGSNIVNLGMSSNGPLLNFVTQKEFGNKENAIILWFYSEENDLGDLKEELNYDILKRYLNNRDFKLNLQKNVKKTDKIATEIIDLNYKNIDSNEVKINFENILKLQNLRNFISLSTNYKIKLTKKKKLNDYNTDILDKFFTVIKKVNNEANLKNSQLIFIYKPSREFYDDRVNISNNQSKNNSKYKNKIISFLNNNNINFIDLDVEMKKYQKDILSLYPFKIRSHFNEQGQEIVAKVLFEKLVGLNLIK